jgi:hypothetical protein
MYKMYIQCTLRTGLPGYVARMTHLWKHEAVERLLLSTHEAICIPSVLAEKRLVKTLLPGQGIFTVF